MKVSEIEISYNPVIKPSERIKISCSKNAAELFRSIWKYPIELKECSYALFLNRANKVIGYLLISVGGISGTIIDPRIVFQTALKANSSSCIIAHNHPSNNPTPSDLDLKLTQQLKEGGKLLDIQLIDHLIILEEGYTSLADEGFL